MSRLGWWEGAVDPAAETHHAGLIEGGPQLHLGAKMPGDTHALTFTRLASAVVLMSEAECGALMPFHAIRCLLVSALCATFA